MKTLTTDMIQETRDLLNENYPKHMTFTSSLEIINDELIRKEGVRRLIVNSTIPQEVIKLYCNNKEYVVRMNKNRKLQMTA